MTVLRKNISPIIMLFVLMGAFAAAPVAQAEDISNLFESVTLTWMPDAEPDEETDLLNAALECESTDLPAQVQFQRLEDVETTPVVESVRLIYPENTPPGQRVTYVDISGVAGTDESLFRTLFSGAVDPGESEPEISITPFVARGLRIRFYHADPGTVTLPMISLQGLDDAASRGVSPDLEPVTLTYVAFKDDNPVGTYVYKRRFDDGKFLYDVSTDIQIKTLNQKRDKEVIGRIKEDCSFETDDGISLESFNCQLEFLNILGTVSGRVFADAILLQMRARDKSADKKSNLRKRSAALPWTIYDRLAQDGLFLGQERAFELAIPDKGDLVPGTARVTNFFPAREGRANLYVVWVAEKSNSQFVQIALIESDGTILRLYDFEWGIDYWLVEDPDEWELQPIVIDFELMLEEAKAQLRDVITMPDSVVRARIAVKWNEAPPETMQLESARQRVVSVEETEPGVFEAELESIRFKPGGESLAASLEPSLEELQSYLLDDGIVETRKPKLVKLAGEIAGEETDPLATARLIFNWLIRHLQPADVNSFFAVSSSEILAKKKGDCKYFAVLFAALARIRGIPTRFAFGQRYIGGSYGYHVWNQIYVDGVWLDVDASDLSFFPGALRVQFYTSASFNEKGHTGALLGFRPEPEILESELGEPDFSIVSGKVPTEITDTFYTDGFFNCRINFPSAFSHEIIDLGFIRKIHFYLQDDPRFSADIFMIPKPKNQDLSSLGLNYREMLHMFDLFGTMRAAKAHKFGKTEFGGGEGYFLTGEFKDRKHQFVHFDLTMLELEDRTFVFHFIGDSDTYRKYSSQLSYIKKTLETF